VKSKLVQIGNSRGVRLPKPIIEQANLGEVIDIQVREGVILISSPRPTRKGWAEAARLGHQRREDGLLDQPMDTQFDQDEWKW
jgi:antitoxin MazE